MSEPEALFSPELAATLAEGARKFGDGKRVPESAGRIRSCMRCEKLRPEFEAHDPRWTPPLAHSWVVQGRRFWSALCRACGEIEQAARAAAGAQKTQAVEVAEKRPQIAMPRTTPARPRLVADWRDERFESP